MSTVIQRIEATECGGESSDARFYEAALYVKNVLYRACYCCVVFTISRSV